MGYQIMTVEAFDKALADGPYAWPGGYQQFFLMADGETLSFEAAQENVDSIHAAINEGDIGDRSWKPVAVDINWEDADMVCAHTNKPIPPSYGGDASE